MGLLLHHPLLPLIVCKVHSIHILPILITDHYRHILHKVMHSSVFMSSHNSIQHSIWQQFQKAIKLVVLITKCVLLSFLISHPKVEVFLRLQSHITLLLIQTKHALLFYLYIYEPIVLKQVRTNIFLSNINIYCSVNIISFLELNNNKIIKVFIKTN